MTELPSVELNKVNSLPECSAIYFVMRSDNQMLYIDKASNLKTRWQGHHRLHQFEALAKKNVLRVAWLLAKKNSLDQLEKDYIKYFYPLLNDTLVPSKSECNPRQRKAFRVILNQSLQKIARYTVVCGIRRNEGLPTIVMRYF